jgi:vacuolar-type H+-ATPase subunit I/STV1
VTETPIRNASQAKPDQLNAYWNAVAYVTALLGWHKREAEFVGDKKHWPCEVSEQALECLNEIDVKLLDPAFPLQDLVSTALATADKHLELANDWERRFNELQSQHSNLRERNKELLANCDAKDVKIFELTEQLTAASAKLEAKDNYCHELLDRIESERKRFAAELRQANNPYGYSIDPKKQEPQP